MSTLQQIAKEKVVAILRLENPESILDVATSLYNGGVRIIEVTLNTPGALKHIESIKQSHPEMVVGAGTVLDENQASQSIMAGADFLLAPTYRQETIEVGNRNGVPVIPGVFTPTEALEAYEAGAEMVKVFPVRHVGTNYMKDIQGPLPFIQGMAVGGVSEENIQDYLLNGWSSVGLGSSLVHPNWIEQEDFDRIEEQARKITTKVKEM